MTAVLGSLFTLFVLLLAAAWYVAENRSLTIGNTTIDFNSHFLTGAWLIALFAGLTSVFHRHKKDARDFTFK
jgi:hypothetical protein